jgi:hypothetical protein
MLSKTQLANTLSELQKKKKKVYVVQHETFILYELYCQLPEHKSFMSCNIKVSC